MSHSVILTKHALERLRERQLSQNWVEETVLRADSQRRGKNYGTREFVKRYGPSQVTVIANQNKDNDWVVVSAWVDPPVTGTKDWRRKQRYRKYQAASWWMKIVMLIGKQTGVWEF